MKFISLGNHGIRDAIPGFLGDVARIIEKRNRRRVNKVNLRCFTIHELGTLRMRTLQVFRLQKLEPETWLRDGYTALRRALRSKGAYILVKKYTLGFDDLQERLELNPDRIIKFSRSNATHIANLISIASR